MKKTEKITIHNFLILVLFFCLFLFNTSCGLDVIEYYYPPVSIIHSPVVNEDNYIAEFDPFENYISFYTNDDDNKNSTTYLGTDIYYKIYNNINDAMKDKASITNTSTGSPLTNESANKMINTYGYHKLKKADSSGNIINSDCLIPRKSDSNKIVEIYPSYNAGKPLFTISGEAQDYIPLRDISYTNKYLNFEFKSYDTEFNNRSVYYATSSDEIDSDVKFNSTASKDNTWYVVFFAVGVGMDYTFNYQYSSVLYLGCLPINDK